MIRIKHRRSAVLSLSEAIGDDRSMLPFTLEQFLNVFATYNKAICPAQGYLLDEASLTPSVELR